MDALRRRKYAKHLDLVRQRWQGALAASGFTAVLVAAGRSQNYLFDDQAPRFRPNPQFAIWFPSPECEGAALLFKPNQRPKLYFHQPQDYWHSPPQPPDWTQAHFDLAVFADVAALEKALLQDARSLRLAFIGRQPLPNLAAAHNPALLLNRLNHQRAYKTEFEVDCLRQANTRAVTGHIAARDAYLGGGAEFDILGAYLAASGQTAGDLPYPCIIGLDEHAAVLHYQHYDRHRGAGSRGFLIDAGASCGGYGSDITRTWAADRTETFAELIAALDEQQQDLIQTIKPGLSYVDLHLAMHRRIATLLNRFQLVKCSAQAAFEQGISRTFMPHGLGHLLGLQTHDVGGWQASPEGAETPPPEHHETLRLTRQVAPGTVFTVEPGLYFIPMLLNALHGQPVAKDLNWPRVKALAPCGGVRIEDNILATANGAENLTRNAFAEQDA